MNITSSANDLLDALKIVTRALPSKTSNQILEGIKIVADNDSVTMTCCDEHMTIVTKANAIVKEPGSGVIPGKLFADVVRRLDGDVALAMNERNVFTVKNRNSKTNLSGQSADLFPALPTVDEQYKISLPQSDFKAMIQKVGFAVAAEDMREVLTGALFEINKGDISMVGLDGYRMACCRMRCANVIDDCSAIIPGSVLNNIAKVLSDNENDFAYISFGGGKLHIQFNDTDVYVVLINGDFVAYKNIIPTSFQTQVEVYTEQFAKAIDRASLIAKDQNNNLLILKILSGKMAVESRSQIGDTHETLEVVQTGDDLTIAFNVKYLVDVVKNISTEMMTISLNSAANPVIMTPAGDGDYIHLVLPVRTQA